MLLPVGGVSASPPEVASAPVGEMASAPFELGAPPPDGEASATAGDMVCAPFEPTGLPRNGAVGVPASGVDASSPAGEMVSPPFGAQPANPPRPIAMTATLSDPANASTGKKIPRHPTPNRHFIIFVDALTHPLYQVCGSCDRALFGYRGRMPRRRPRQFFEAISAACRPKDQQESQRGDGALDH